MECQLHSTVMFITRCWNWHCLQDGRVNLPKQTARTSGGVKELSSVSSFFTTSPLSFQSISITFISLAHSAASKPPMSVSPSHWHTASVSPTSHWHTALQANHSRQYHLHLFIFCKILGFTKNFWQKWQHIKHSNRLIMPKSDTIQLSSGQTGHSWKSGFLCFTTDSGSRLPPLLVWGLKYPLTHTCGGFSSSQSHKLLAHTQWYSPFLSMHSRAVLRHCWSSVRRSMMSPVTWQAVASWYITCSVAKDCNATQNHSGETYAGSGEPSSAVLLLG